MASTMEPAQQPYLHIVALWCNKYFEREKNIQQWQVDAISPVC